jgi:hypothetical protein
MSKFTMRPFRILLGIVLSGVALSCFFSCEKADVAPYGNPVDGAIVSSYIMPSDTMPNFKASVNNSAVLSFTASKNIVGSNTNLKGTTANYAITITFPSSTGPGSWNMGNSGPATALLVNGASHYVVKGSNGIGLLKIDSISLSGRYYGTFSFIAKDTVASIEISVSQGSFSHL